MGNIDPAHSSLLPKEGLCPESSQLLKLAGEYQEALHELIRTRPLEKSWQLEYDNPKMHLNSTESQAAKVCVALFLLSPDYCAALDDGCPQKIVVVRKGDDPYKHFEY